MINKVNFSFSKKKKLKIIYKLDYISQRQQPWICMINRQTIILNFFQNLLLCNSTGHRMTWSAYHRMDDIVGYLEYLAKTYPDLCSVQEIGKSFEGRSLTVLRLVGHLNDM